MRSLSSGVQAALVAGRCSPFYMADIQFTSGHSYLWTGIGTISWNGHNWVGVGNLGGVSAIQESSEVVADNIVLTLSGIPTSLISQAISECSQSYSVVVYLGFLDDSGAVIVDPVKCFSGRMDVPTIQDGADTATIAITAENHLIALQRASERRYTAADQLLTVSGDKGFNYVASIQNWSGVWGKAGGGGQLPNQSGNVAGAARLTGGGLVSKIAKVTVT